MSIKGVLEAIIPKGRSYRIQRQRVGTSGTHILRIITPAWRTLPVHDRVMKVSATINEGVSAKQREKIFRVSVLTERELKQVRKYSPVRSLPRPAAKRPSRKPAVLAA